MKLKSNLKKLLTLDFYLDALAATLRFFMHRNPLFFYFWIKNYLIDGAFRKDQENKKLYIQNYKNFNQTHPYISASSSMVLILLMLFSTVYFSFLRKTEPAAAWWNEQWMYRKSIALSNSGSAQSNTQVKIFSNVDLSSLVSAGKLQSDLDDLRFTDINGNNLKYWIEDGTSSSVDLWALIPNVPASGATIYMYYGNSSASVGKSIVGGEDFPGLSCQAIKLSGAGTDGVYYIDPNGNEISDKYQVYCDQTTDGGGWTLVYKYVATGGYSQSQIIAGSSSLNSITAKLDTERADGRNANAFNDFWTADGMSWLSYFKKYNNANSITDTKWLESDLESNVDWGTDVYFNGKTTGCHEMPGKVSLKSSTGTNYGSTSYRYVAYTDGRGYLAAQSGTYTDTCGQSSGNLLTTVPGEGGHMWYTGSSSTDKNKDRCTWTCWVAPTDYTHSEGYSGREWYAKGIKAVISNISSGTPGSEEKSKGPVAYWNFDEGQGTTAYDGTSNGNDGTISGATWKNESECLSDKCLAFDGSDDYVSIGATQFGSTSGSVSVWFRPVTGLANATMIFGHQNGNNRLYIGSDAWPRIKVGVADNGGIDTGQDIAYGEWQHVVLTYNSGAWSFYYNGKQVSSGSYSGSITFVSPEIGDDGGSGWTNNFKGNIDEVKVYQYARTADEIKQDYNAGLAGMGTSKGVGAALGSDSPKWLTDGLVGYWKMDESSTPSVDSSGNGNSGTWNGNAAAAAGKFGNSITLDGSGDYISIPEATNLNSNNITISAWIKTAGSSPYAGIVDKFVGVGYQINIDDGNRLRFDIGGSPYANVSGTTNLESSSWQFVTVSYDGSTMRVYVNGIQENSKSYSGGITSSGQALLIGNDSESGSRYFSGSIDDVRIYNRALSPDEVKGLYEWAPGPVAHWKMDEGSGTGSGAVKDSSGNGNNGSMEASMTESDWVQGKYGKALDFDGSNDYVDAGNSVNLNNFGSGGITVGAWVYVRGEPNAAFPTIAEKSSGDFSNSPSNQKGFFLSAPYNNSPARNIRWGIGDGTGYNNVTYSIDNPTLQGHWHYISGVADPANISSPQLKLYIDGVLVGNASRTYTGSIDDNTKNLMIGRWSIGRYFNGLIDDLKIYNYARTSKQIVEDMNAGHPVGGSPVGSQVGYWKFDEGYGTTAYNSGNGGSSLNGNLGVGSSAPTWTNDGKFEKALDFNGNSYISMGDNLDMGLNDFSVSAWIKKDTDTYRAIISKGDAGIGAAKGYRLRVESNNTILFTVTGDTEVAIQSTQTITNGAWYHVTATKSSSKMKVYVNGVEWATSNSPPAGSIDNDINFYIGRQSSWYWDGIIDEVKIYNSALTEDEIKIDMNQGKSLILGNTGTDSSGNASQSASREYCIPGDTSACSPPVAEWKMDKINSTTVADTSGNGHDGTVSNMDSSNVKSAGECKEGRCLEFNGSDEYVGPTRFTLSTTMSFEAWVKTTSTDSAVNYAGNAAQNVIGDNTSGVYLGFGVHGGKVRYNYYASSWASVDGNSSVNDGNWHHIVVTHNRSAGTIKIYVDGKVDGTGSIVSGSTGGVNCIGRGYAGDYFTGQIDQVKIYNYVRSDSQIAWDYNRGKPVGHWKMDEGEGTTVYDHSGNGNNGTMTNMDAGTDWVDGKFAKALDFDGSDDYVSIADDSALDISSEITMSAWVYPNSFTNVGGNNYPTIISKSSNYRWFFGTNGKVYTRFVGFSDLVTNSSVPLNEWTHLTMTFNGSGFKWYINGKLDNSDSQSGSLTTSDTAWRFGDYSDSRYLQGKIDDVRIFNYALTAQQVKDVMNDGAIRYGD